MKKFLLFLYVFSFFSCKAGFPGEATAEEPYTIRLSFLSNSEPEEDSRSKTYSSVAPLFLGVSPYEAAASKGIIRLRPRQFNEEIYSSLAPFFVGISPHEKLVLSSYCAVDGTHYPELKKFVRMFGLPKSLEDAVADIARDPLPWRTYKVKHWPLYVKEDDLSRIINAACLKTFIKTQGIGHLIGLPDKYVAKVGNKWKTLVRRIDGHTPTGADFSVKTTKAILLLIKETGLGDLHQANMKVTKDKRIMIIDTEPRSFNEDEGVQHGYTDFIQSLLEYEGLPLETQTLLNEELIKLAKEPFPKKSTSALFRAYGPPNIDIEKAQEEFTELKKETKPSWLDSPEVQHQKRAMNHPSDPREMERVD
jgi:hypothetical protein